MIKALLGKAVLPDAHPLTTGGIGLVGTRPSQEAMEACDTLLIVGSTFPYIEYYPKPDQARGVQIDRDATRIGLRFPAEVGLAGDAAVTLRMLNERLEQKADRSFLKEAQERMQAWRELLRTSANKPGKPMKPQAIAQALGDSLARDAIVVSNSGHNTGLCARHVELTDRQMYGVSGHMRRWLAASLMPSRRALPIPGVRWWPSSATPHRFADPARFSLAHGGKDRHPYPVPLKVYDETIRVLKSAVQKAKLGNTEELHALRRLDDQARLLKRNAAGPSLEVFIAAERQRSPALDGRSVFGWEKDIADDRTG